MSSDTSGDQPQLTSMTAGPADLLADNPFRSADLGGVGGGFVRTRPGTSGQVTLTASHPTLGQASARLAVTPAPSVDFRTSARRRHRPARGWRPDHLRTAADSEP
ncbi:MAG: hypothetical protein M3022_00150, partial [Actinomycetota bacterium]|nr:hypothetical protein [Actinomycetota bacterium]